jgi:hypothetical protein
MDNGPESSGVRTQLRCVAEQGGDALGAQSTVTQMGHSDSPGSGSIVRDILFKKHLARLEKAGVDGLAESCKLANA